jgi:hypothetical protein
LQHGGVIGALNSGLRGDRILEVLVLNLLLRRWHLSRAAEQEGNECERHEGC